jgi:pSer/pThr/pTyr-binding forkhead associated (FHA) protein
MTVTVPVDSTAEQVQVELDELPAGVGMLVVTRGPISGSRFALDEPLVTAGRHPDSVIFLDDITVSRRHAEVRQVDGGGYRVADVGSLNGTYLNRQRVEEADLHDGDELQIGTFKLLFLAGRT